MSPLETCALAAFARYTGCPVAFQSGQLSGQAATDSAGNFAIPVPGATDFSNGLVSLSAGAPNCVDALTRLPVPFALGALVPASKGAHRLWICQFPPCYLVACCLWPLASLDLLCCWCTCLPCCSPKNWQRKDHL